MLEDPLNFARALPLLLAGGWMAPPRKVGSWAIGESLARIGFGLAKVILLGLWLEDVFDLATHAAPCAASSWSAFIGMVSFSALVYLVFSGTADVMTGMVGLCKHSLPAMVHDPFWAKGYVDFWNRWGTHSTTHVPTVRSAMLRCGLFLLGVVISCRRFNESMAVWMALNAGLILLDSQLGRIKGWQSKVPHWIKSSLMIALFALSSPLLFSAHVEDALTQWSRLFNSPDANLYSSFLDARLTSPSVCWLIWLCVLTALALPNFSWWMAQRRSLRWVTQGTGVLLLVAFMMIVTIFIPSTPAPIRKIVTQVVSILQPDGLAGISIGADDWLYPRSELDRLTQQSRQIGLETDIVRLQKQLQAEGSHLLLVPVPDKIGLHPEPLLPGKYKGAVYPPGYHEAIRHLKEIGVDVMDLTDKLWDDQLRRPVYGKQDSHWRWDAMKEMAVQVSRYIRQQYPQVIKEETPMVDAVFMERQDIGDLARSWRLRDLESYSHRDTAQMVGLRGLTGAEASPVLVVGGDLIRVFDAPDLSFAPVAATDAPAGFPTQLGALLGRGLEVSDERDFTEVEKKAAGKKLVVWVVRAGRL